MPSSHSHSFPSLFLSLCRWHWQGSVFTGGGKLAGALICRAGHIAANCGRWRRRHVGTGRGQAHIAHQQLWDWESAKDRRASKYHVLSRSLSVPFFVSLPFSLFYSNCLGGKSTILTLYIYYIYIKPDIHILYKHDQEETKRKHVNPPSPLCTQLPPLHPWKTSTKAVVGCVRLWYIRYLVEQNEYIASVISVFSVAYPRGLGNQ